MYLHIRRFEWLQFYSVYHSILPFMCLQKVNKVVKLRAIVAQKSGVSGLFLHEVTRWHHSLSRIVIYNTIKITKKVLNLMYDAQSPEAFQSAIAEMLVIFSKIGSGLLCLETGKRQL